MNHVDNYGKFYKLLKLLPAQTRRPWCGSLPTREPSTYGR